MKRFADNAIAATGILALILAGYAYVLTVSFKTDANAKAIEAVEIKQDKLEQMGTDIAVIREQVTEIGKRLDKGK